MKKNQSLGLPKHVRDTIRLQNEFKNWDQRLHALYLARKYKEANTEEEMKSKIIQWRTYAQVPNSIKEAATALLPYYQEQVGSIAILNDYDDIKSNLTGGSSNESENNNQENDQSEEKNGPSAALDDMMTMLNAIGIDPDMVHYSAEQGDFYQ
ncbi:hypothetical protein BCR42DRAFT_477594 [Absidia repens]|uniref:Uncharacterized protein n=1 Tax=Absidia repens TaxID=90262 RepID=A0A1X2IL30_9FUNG|nr:hypothetical protein BCR42DRAFT_477594 [Absidia repens]